MIPGTRDFFASKLPPLIVDQFPSAKMTLELGMPCFGILFGWNGCQARRAIEGGIAAIQGASSGGSCPSRQ